MGQIDVHKFNSEQIAELQNRVTELEMTVNNMRGFMKNQIQINEFFRRIVDVKYTKEELLDIYNKFTEMHKNDEKKDEDSMHKNCTNLKNSEENCEAPDEKGAEN